jgi:HEAT repeat protein
MVEEQLLMANKAGQANSRRTFRSATVNTTLWLVILLTASATTVAQTQDWLKYVRGLGFGERLAEIKRVSTLPQAVQRERVAALIQLLKDQDQSVRVVAATEIAEIRDVSRAALPQLINNFEQTHGEEGTVYVEAVAAFGEQALPPLQPALESSNWLVRSRACDAVRLIKPKLYRDGECKDKAP